MEILNQQSEIEKLSDNMVLGNVSLNNSIIQFMGTGNVLYCEGNVRIINSTIKFSGSNAIIFLRNSKYDYCLNVVIYNKSLLYFGRDNFINQKLNIIVSEQQNIIIGNDCIISFDCWIRTADAHLIYDSLNKKRINNSKGILIGDHVWIGQQVLVLKGSQIHSGSIVGAGSVVANKKIPSNCIYAGNPLKKIRDNVFFCSDSVHMYLNEDIVNSQICESNEYIYNYDPNEKVNFDYIDRKLKTMECVKEKIEFIKDILIINECKNRFSI
jgi:acetyltransferase-like isoleucine patch superfamily enzyme